MLRGLKAAGHEPAAFAFYGLAGNKIPYEGYTVYPNSNFETWGNDVVKNHIEDFKAEAIVTLIDLFVLNPEVWGSLEVPWVRWVPIDSVGIGPETLKRLEIPAATIAMSEFGAKQMEDYGIHVDGTIYHAVDTEAFKPLDKAECRAELGIVDDCFLVGLVMANKGDRKQYPLQLQAIRNFADENPDLDVRVYIHAEPTNAMGGWDLRALVEQIGLKGQVYSSNQYFTSVLPLEPARLAHIMNAMDVLMNCSSGEGFGIPIVEAQACGVPVITHGVTAMPEITHYGYTVESAAKGLGSHYGWQFAPDVEDMTYRLNCVYRGMLPRTDQLIGIQWVKDFCGIHNIVSQWDYILRGLEQHQEDVSQSAHEVWV